MSRTVVAVCSTTGPGSGKSTYLDQVVKPRLPESVHIRFSDPIKSFLCRGLHELHGKGMEDYEELKRTEILPGITGRDFMIAAGDEVRIALRDSFYTEIAMQRITKLPEGVDVVIDDLRKLPEIEALLKETAFGVDLLIVNVMRSLDEDSSDMEFGYQRIKSMVAEAPGNARAMAMVWDGNGGFRRVQSA